MTHGARNNSTPSAMCTYSLATDSGWLNDHNPAAARSTPNTTRVHSDAVSLAVTSGESAVSSPITTAPQSCHLVQLPRRIVAPSLVRTAPKCALVGQPVKMPVVSAAYRGVPDG